MKSIDNLVKNLLKYARRPEWEARLSDVWHEHTAQAAKQIHISPDELTNLIEEEGWHDALLGIVFEDFVSRRANDEPSFADVYLRRAGWREAPAARKYLEAMASSRLSLYEIVEVQRDRGLVLRDLLQEGPSVFVHEISATHSALRWDVIAARVVSLLEKQVLTGGILRFYRDSADRLIESLSKHQASVIPVYPERLELRVTTAWLADAVERRKRPLPELSNTDGEPLLFGESRLPLRAPAAEISSRLDAAPDWERAGDAPPVWNWSGGAPAAKTSSGKGIHLGSFAPSGEPLRGTAELKSHHLLFTTNSRERMERGLARLSHLLAEAIGTPVTSYQSAEAAMASPGRTEQQPPPDIPPAELAAIKFEFLDQHYRQTLRSQIPALHNKTPHQALRTENGRQRVIAWLKYLENGEARRAADTGEAPYDLSWMWQELGLAQEQHD